MQNKTAIWVFTILLTVACLYQLSFSWFTGQVEDEAVGYAEGKIDSLQQVSPELAPHEIDSARRHFKREYLQRKNDEVIYPVLGYTYNDCKTKEINLGLDLKGGMSVTLEVSIPDLVMELSGNTKNQVFKKAFNSAREKAKTSQTEFLTLLRQEYEKVAPNGKLAAIFHSRQNKGMFPADATNQEIIEILRDKKKAAILNTERILRTRIDKFGVTNPKIQKQQFSGRIIVELPGVKDKERVRDYLQATASLEFWETFENREVYQYLDRANSRLSKVLYPGSTEDTASSRKDTANAEGEVTDKTEVSNDTIQEPMMDTSEEDGVDTSDEKATQELLEQLEEEEEEEDTASASQVDEDESLSREEQRKQNPLFYFLRPNVGQDQESGTMKLREGPVVGFAQITDTAKVNELLGHPSVRNLFPDRLELMWSAEPFQGNMLSLYAIKVSTRTGEPPLDGEVIVDASQEFDRNGDVQVQMQMNADGAAVWKNLTRDNIGRAVAIVMDNYVYSAPIVQSEIPNGRSSISMGGGNRAENMTEAKDLANLLKAGALPAPIDIVDESVVGPSLGQENIDAGLTSFIIALSVILLYMIIYYSGAGIVSDIALIANLFFLIGALASLQASLTLPGIAGIVLTIGIAVDANVLIYDRVREEIRKGKGVQTAVTEGYKKAYAAIVDANITTLLTAIILATFGSGPIKGFATTLIIGIFTSLYASIFITRLIFTIRLDRKKNINFSSKLSKNAFTNMKVKFLEKRKIGYVISSIVILVGVFSFFSKGLNLGVEFTGGRTYKVRFEEPKGVNEVRSSLGEVFRTPDGRKLPPEVKTFGATNQFKITTKYLIDEEGEEADKRVEEKLGSGLESISSGYKVLGSRKVDPTISNDIKVSAFWAVVFSLVVIFLYILIRFRKWQYGLGALFAMFHDVLVVLACFSIFYGLLPFSLEIDQAFIAAILTVVGYSINDTVVVYDRLREYLKEHHRKRPFDVINMALNSTLGRTFNTSMTTFIVLLMIFIFGSETIKGFAFALMVGVIVGTYSSLFIATPSVLDFSKEFQKKEEE